MLLQLLIFFFMGILFGIFTGLIPGIHVNLIGVFLISLSSSLFLSINPIYLVIFIVSLGNYSYFYWFYSFSISRLSGHWYRIKCSSWTWVIKKRKGLWSSNSNSLWKFSCFDYLACLFYSFYYNSLKNLWFYKRDYSFLLIVVSIILISLEKKRLNALLVFLLTGF